MNKELKPTWDYILNDLAFGNLLVKCLYSEYPDIQDKYDLQYQIKLKGKEIERLKNELSIKTTYIEDLLKTILKSDDFKMQREVYEHGIEYDKKLKALKEGK